MAMHTVDSAKSDGTLYMSQALGLKTLKDANVSSRSRTVWQLVHGMHLSFTADRQSYNTSTDGMRINMQK